MASQAQAEVVIIGNKSLAVESVTLKQAKKLWLKKSLKLPGTGKVKLVDQFKANATYTEFYRKIVKKKPSQLKAYWAKVTFTGKAFPPEQMADDASVIDWVANTSNAMGYVDGSAVNDSVKRLLTVK
ncbi:MAG: hypothetical protein COB30_004955 [Ectothiorhodospiraceae bacterium]|nr:hypothetical protein [Ectothiorhodospiraceae bacterium]